MYFFFLLNDHFSKFCSPLLIPDFKSTSEVSFLSVIIWESSLSSLVKSPLKCSTHFLCEFLLKLQKIQKHDKWYRYTLNDIFHFLKLHCWCLRLGQFVNITYFELSHLAGTLILVYTVYYLKLWNYYMMWTVKRY